MESSCRRSPKGSSSYKEADEAAKVGVARVAIGKATQIAAAGKKTAKKPRIESRPGSINDITKINGGKP